MNTRSSEALYTIQFQRMARKQAAISFPLRTYTDHQLLADLALKGVYLTSPQRSTLLLTNFLYFSVFFWLLYVELWRYLLLPSSGVFWQCWSYVAPFPLTCERGFRQRFTSQDNWVYVKIFAYAGRIESLYFSYLTYKSKLVCRPVWQDNYRNRAIN